MHAVIPAFADVVVVEPPICGKKAGLNVLGLEDAIDVHGNVAIPCRGSGRGLGLLPNGDRNVVPLGGGEGLRKGQRTRQSGALGLEQAQVVSSCRGFAVSLRAFSLATKQSTIISFMDSAMAVIFIIVTFAIVAVTEED